MTFSMAGRFAFQNLKANRLWEIPFILSSGMMLILFNIMAGLLGNSYVRTRHSSLPMLINLGIILTGIFTFIFVLYTTNFLLKRRNKEFALYGILGLEKKHLRKIISIEFFVLFALIGLIGVAGGYVFGQLTFLGLNRLMRDVSGRLMDYPFSMSAMLSTLALAAILYVITVMRSGFRIYLSTPVQLLGKQHSGEGEPKSRRLLMAAGFAALSGGYYIAFTIKGVLSSLLYFFLAALLVMFATYLLYVSFSVIILKSQRRRKSYFKPAKFLGISGLLHRMKSNAVSLASISILSTGVVIALSATATIYSNIETTARNTMPREYQLESPITVDENNYAEAAKDLVQKVESTVEDKNQISDGFTSYVMITTGLRQGNAFAEYTREKAGVPNFLMVYDLDSYNARTHRNIRLNEDEVLLCANQTSMADMEELTIGERTFHVTKIENIVPSNYAVDVYCLVVKDFEVMRYIGGRLRTLNMKTNQLENTSIACIMDWNVEGIADSEYKEALKELGEETGYGVEIHSEYLSEIYEMDGGFLFLGIVIGLIFLTGTILITYYKQISEGYEDREKYQIMRKVGLDDALIKKTAASQIVWMFFAPLAIAVIHCLAASKIVYQLLGLFAVRSFLQYATFFGLVIAVFFVVYFMIFKLTSRAYYKIVQ